jgi:hypothetical protein
MDANFGEDALGRWVDSQPTFGKALKSKERMYVKSRKFTF